MKSILKISLVTFLMTVIFGTAQAQMHNWQILGKKTVNMKADHDEIIVTASEGLFTAIRFKVVKAPIFVKNFRIIYGNGSSENYVINKRIPRGKFSRSIDLKGNKRIIKKININYKTVPNVQGRAHIIVFGRH